MADDNNKKSTSDFDEDNSFMLDLTNASAGNNTMSNPDAFKQNGDRTSTQGPCECGFRHWCDGKEYDFVFQINLSNLPSGHLPFDLGDNAYKAANDYVTRHVTTADWNDQKYVNVLVDWILKTTAPYEKKKAETTPTKKEAPKPATGFDPYKTHMSTPTFTAHFNPVTNKFEGVQYATDSFTRPKPTLEEERQADLVESHQMKVRKEIEEREREKEAIKNRIELDNKERAKEMQLRKSLVDASPQTKRAPHGTTAVLEDGKLKWVARDSALSSSKQSPLPASPGVATIHGLRQKEHDGHPHHREAESDSEEEAIEIDEEAVKKTFEKYNGKPPQWSRDMILYKYRELGGDELQKLLLECGMQDQNTREQVVRWAAAQLTPAQNQEKSRIFGGEGHRLGSSQVPAPEASAESLAGTATTTASTTASTTNSSISLISVNPNEPMTFVRVRLANGVVETVTLNESHTIQQLQEHVQILSNSNSFSLRGGFPPKLLDTPALSIKAANLSKSTVVQTLC